jgi:hypothetical protein
MKGHVVEAIPGRRLVWQLRKVIKLPVRLSPDLTDDDGGVAITHTIEAGFEGPGRLLDPLIRLYFSGKFAAAMDEHVRTEFPLLRITFRRSRRTPALADHLASRADSASITARNPTSWDSGGRSKSG